MFSGNNSRRFVKTVFTLFNVGIEPVSAVPGTGRLAQEDGSSTLYVKDTARPSLISETIVMTAARLALGFGFTPVSPAEERQVLALAARLAVPEYLVVMAEANGWHVDRLAFHARTGHQLAGFALANRQLVYVDLERITRQNLTFQRVIMALHDRRDRAV